MFTYMCFVHFVVIAQLNFNDHCILASVVGGWDLSPFRVACCSPCTVLSGFLAIRFARDRRRLNLCRAVLAGFAAQDFTSWQVPFVAFSHWPLQFFFTCYCRIETSFEWRLSNSMWDDALVPATVADTGDDALVAATVANTADDTELATIDTGFPNDDSHEGHVADEQVLHGFDVFDVDSAGAAPGFSGVLASDPISSFATLSSDPISQFQSFPENHGHCADLFGVESLDESGIDESMDRLMLRRAMGSQCDENRSVGTSEFLDGVGISVDVATHEVSPNCNHSAALQAFNQSLQSSAPKFMWETDGFLSAVFSPGISVVDQLFKPVALKRPSPGFVDLTDDRLDEAPIAKALRKGAVRPIYLGSFSRSSGENECNKRKSYLSGWVTLVLINSDAFSALQDAMAEAEHPDRECIMRCLAECFAAKATSTLGKRLGAMSKYASHCEKIQLPAFPLSERSLYSYLSALNNDHSSSASVGKSFLEAVRFSAAVLGLHGLERDKVPPRVSGLAEMLARRAPCVKQAMPLTVKQVALLEETCCNADALQDRILVGGLLLMLYSCARASDMARVVKLVIDRVDPARVGSQKQFVAGFIEASALQTKGARSQAHKRTLLPLVAPMAGISEWNWWDAYLQAREAMGMVHKNGLAYPLLCRFDDQGCALTDALQASEIGCYLRNVLKVEHASSNDIRSHSLKVTTLSWMAKAGCSLSVRRSLGHHLDPGARSATIYSRDAMAPPLRELCRILKMVADGAFAPDNTRSGRFKDETQGVPAAQTRAESEEESLESYEMPFSEKLVGDTDDSGTDASSDAGEKSDSELLDTTTLWELVEPRHRPNLVQVKPGFETWMHVQSHAMHLLAKDGKRFICGRMVSDRYKLVQQGASCECTRCQTCYMSKLTMDGARLQSLS